MHYAPNHLLLFTLKSTLQRFHVWSCHLVRITLQNCWFLCKPPIPWCLCVCICMCRGRQGGMFLFQIKEIFTDGAFIFWNSGKAVIESQKLETETKNSISEIDLVDQFHALMFTNIWSCWLKYKKIKYRCRYPVLLPYKDIGPDLQMVSIGIVPLKSMELHWFPLSEGLMCGCLLLPSGNNLFLTGEGRPGLHIHEDHDS